MQALQILAVWQVHLLQAAVLVVVAAVLAVATAAVVVVVPVAVAVEGPIAFVAVADLIAVEDEFVVALLVPSSVE